MATVNVGYSSIYLYYDRKAAEMAECQERACVMADKMSAQVMSKTIQWTPELVSRFWDNIAASRLTECSFSKIAGRALLIAVDHLLLKDGRVTLDFGAGDGDLIKLMCERGCKVMGYEPSTVRAQTLVHTLSNNPNFVGVVDDKTERQFDCVMMTEVIEHILDEQFDEVLTRVASLTAKDGLLILTTPNNEDLELSYAYCPVSDLWYHRWQHVRSFTLDSLAQTLSRYGFQEIVSHRLEFGDDYFLSFDPLWGGADPQCHLPSYLRALRQNSPAYCGHEQNILYVGRKG